MIQHTALAVRSETAAVRIFEHLFNMKRLYEFDIPQDAFEALFHISTSAHALVYDAGNTHIEVFVLPEPISKPPGFEHLCVEVNDRAKIIAKAEDLGFEIRKYHREDTTVIFVMDDDGNLFEIKEKPPNPGN